MIISITEKYRNLLSNNTAVISFLLNNNLQTCISGSVYKYGIIYCLWDSFCCLNVNHLRHYNVSFSF